MCVTYCTILLEKIKFAVWLDQSYKMIVDLYLFTMELMSMGVTHAYLLFKCVYFLSTFNTIDILCLVYFCRNNWKQNIDGVLIMHPRPPGMHHSPFEGRHLVFYYFSFSQILSLCSNSKELVPNNTKIIF